jgi:RNA polymerase sigma-70 factor (ECF subfamily)
MEEQGDPAEETDERHLLGCVAQGSRECFQQLYQRCAGELLGYLLRWTRDRALAEDVMQDVFLAVWLKASTYRPELGSPLSWMCTMARHKVVDRWRSRPPEDGLGDDAPALDHLTQADPTLALSVTRALDRLSGDQRRAVELACLGGYTHQEASAALGVPLGTLKSRIRLSLKHLRTHLGEET